MKRTIRYITLALSIIIGNYFHTSFANTIVSCNGFDSGGRSCDVCAQDRTYLGTDFSLWDWYYNTTPGLPEVVFSGLASSATIETMGHLSLNNGQATNTSIVSAFSPAGKDRVVIFNPRGLRFTATPANRDTIAARAVYDIHASVGGWDHTLTSNAWNYTDGVESVVGGITNLSTSVSVVPGTRSFFTTTPPRLHHVECQNLYVSWCGDSVVDSGREQCDLWTQNGQPGSACSATCTPVTTPPPPPPTNPYSACIVGNPTADCSTNTYANQAACLAVNPAGSGRTCYPNDIVSCNASRAVQCPVTPTPPGWGGGGGGPVCTPGNFTRDSGNVVPAPISAVTPGLCLAGETVGNFTDTLNGASHKYSWSCNTISAGLACTAFFNGGGGGWGGWGGGGGWWPSGWGPLTVPGSSSYCWNGVVERPNAAGQYENCDTTAAWCINCNIISTNPGSAGPGNLMITTPGTASMNINTFKLIVWSGVPVFSPGDTVAFETNNPIYLENKTATITNHSSLIGGTTVSKTINQWVGGTIRFKTSETREVRDGSGNIIVPWTITYDQVNYANTLRLFDGSELQWLKGDTSTIVSGGYDDTIVTSPTYRDQGLYVGIQFLESPFNVRVSRPIIGNIAGWSAFVGSPLGYSVDTVVQSFMNNLRSGNFTTSTVNVASSYGLSSATTSVSDNSALSQSITSGGVSEAGRITSSSQNTSGIHTSTSIASEFEIDAKSTKLGDAANIRVFKDGDVSIDGNLDLVGVKTVIIENGNLIINKDIRYADKTSSFAFIVKQGNIIIADSVQNIAGVYVTLAGAIQSNGVSTPNRLTVDGSLYGNTSDLVNNRSYVRGQMDYTALNVGVIVNYSNRAIMYPPPSLSRFLDQYSIQRVAR